jgi:hypothetical protein
MSLSLHFSLIKADKRRRYGLLSGIASWAGVDSSFHEGELSNSESKTFISTEILIIKTMKPAVMDLTIGETLVSNVPVKYMFIYSGPCTAVLKNTNAVEVDSIPIGYSVSLA